MTIDELLASYDPADLEYDEWLGHETENKTNHLFSFIPTKEECEEIFLGGLGKIKMKRNKVFVVTYWDNGVEPVVTVFDNQENAEKCYSFFKGKHDGCCVDEVPVYKHFGETGE